MAVKFLSKQSPETETSTILQSKPLELVINVVISGFRGEDLK